MKKIGTSAVSAMLVAVVALGALMGSAGTASAEPSDNHDEERAIVPINFELRADDRLLIGGYPASVQRTFSNLHKKSFEYNQAFRNTFNDCVKAAGGTSASGAEVKDCAKQARRAGRQANQTGFIETNPIFDDFGGSINPGDQIANGG